MQIAKNFLRLWVGLGIVILIGVVYLSRIGGQDARLGWRQQAENAPKSGVMNPTPAGSKTDWQQGKNQDQNGNASMRDATTSRVTQAKRMTRTGSDEQQSLWRAFEEARYAFQPVSDKDQARPGNEGVKYFAANPAQDLTIRLMDKGAQIRSGQVGKNWQATLSLGGENSKLLRRIEYDGTRFEYHGDGIIEWYKNAPKGIEHGFTLRRRPANATNSGFAISLKVEGLSPQNDDSGDICLVDSDGVAVVRYAGLKVWDAAGKQLEAAMAAHETAIEYRVADADAIYPITIDPMITSLEQKLLPEMTGDGVADDQFGRAVAIDGQTAVIGANLDNQTGAADAGSAYVFVREGATWSLQAKLVASDYATSDQFGWAVAISGDTIVVGAYLNDMTAGANVGSAYVFVRSGTNWTQQVMLAASDGMAGDQFGYSVAIDGDTVVVGASLDDVTGATNAGSAYVFTRSAGVWSQQAQLIAGDRAASDSFGVSVSLSGNTALIGAYLDNTAGGSDAGSAYVFQRSGSLWTQQAQLFAPDGLASDQFGFSVGLYSDTAVIGSPFDDTSSGTDAGNAHVFARSGSLWAWQSQLTSSRAGITQGGQFGNKVAIYGDTIVVGSPNDDTSGGSDAGSATVFFRTGTTWAEQAVLMASDGLAFDFFGSAVAINGQTVIVGANADDTDGGANAGSSYIFMRSGQVWSNQVQVSAGNGADGDIFGLGVDLEGDTAIVGSQYEDSLVGGNSGMLYVFTRSAMSWSLQAKLLGSDVAGGDEFSFGLALSGNTIVAGTRLHNSGTGAAYVFLRAGSSWSQQAKITASDGTAGDNFGRHVDIEGDTIVIGAWNNDTPQGTDAGSAYVFTRNGQVWTQQAQLFASDAAVSDKFGACSISSDYIIVGAAYADLGTEADAGKAYVFKRNGVLWSEESILVAPDGAASDLFGFQASIVGNTVLISSYDDDTTAGADTGSAYVFTREGAAWSLQAKLTASDAGAGDEFGHSIDLKGNRAVIGAWSDDTSMGGNTGSVYVFDRVGTTWTQSAQLNAPDAEIGDYFGGFSVATDQDTVIVSSYADDSALPSFLSGYLVSGHGSVYIFRLTESTVQISSQPQSLTVSQGQLASLTVTATGIGTVTYAWEKDGVVIPGAASPTLTFQAVKPWNVGTYRVRITDSGGTLVSEAAQLTLNTAQPVSLWQDLLLFLPLAGNTTDLSPSARTVTQSNVTSGVSPLGTVAGSASFNGTSSRMDFSPNLPNLSEMTVSCWVKTTGASGNRFIFADWDDADGNDLSMSLDGLKLVVGTTKNGSTIGYWTSPDIFVANSWKHVIWVMGATQSKIFIDGVLYQTINATASNSGYKLNSNIGYSAYGGGQQFLSGGLASFRIYGRTLTDSEAVQLYQYDAPMPEIELEQPSGTALVDGSATTTWQALPTGGSGAAALYVISNVGVANLLNLGLTKTGTHAADFLLGSLSTTTLAPGESTTFTVTFAPSAGVSGTRTATLQVASNDADEIPFDIALSGTAYSTTLDADADGMNDWAEFKLSALGFNWQTQNTALVSTFYDNAAAAGLFTSTQVQNLNVGTPMLQRNLATGEVTLTIGVDQSTDLTKWTPLPMTGPQVLINAQGRLEFRFTSPANAAFYRLMSRPTP